MRLGDLGGGLARPACVVDVVTPDQRWDQSSPLQRGGRWLYEGGDWEVRSGQDPNVDPHAEELCRTGRFIRPGPSRGSSAEERIHELPEGMYERGIARAAEGPPYKRKKKKNATPLIDSLGTRLRAARIAKGLTQAEVHVATGLAISTLSQTETNSKGLGIVNLTKLAALYEVSLDDLVRGLFDHLV